jgi:hypothetical protein
MKDDIITTSIIILLAAPIAWFGAQYAFSLVVRPYRTKLSRGLSYLKANSQLIEAESDYLDHLWETAFAPRSAILLSLMYVIALTMKPAAIRREFEDLKQVHPNFWADERLDDLMDWYFISIFAANPLFGVLAIVLRVLWHIKLAILVRQVDDRSNFVAMPPFETAARV